MPTKRGAPPPWYSNLAASERFPPQQVAEWQERVATSPEVWGVTRSRWTLKSLPEVEPAWAAYSVSGLWRYLRALRIAYKRGRHYVHSPDPDYIVKRDAAHACLEDARCRPADVATYYLDELSCYRQPTVAQDWHAAGSTQPLAERSHRSNSYHRVLGALNATTGQVVFRMAQKTSSDFICRFLRHLRAQHPQVHTLNVILDNWYQVHNHLEVQATARQEQITLVYLPTSSPWLNPIEKLWRKAYQEILHLHRHSDKWAALKDRMQTFLNGFNQPSPELLKYVGLLPD
jgi:putative transposase